MMRLKNKNIQKRNKDNFNHYTKPKNPNKKEWRIKTYEISNRLLNAKQKVLKGFKSKMLQIWEQTQWKGSPSMSVLHPLELAKELKI